MKKPVSAKPIPNKKACFNRIKNRLLLAVLAFWVFSPFIPALIKANPENGDAQQSNGTKPSPSVPDYHEVPVVKEVYNYQYEDGEQDRGSFETVLEEIRKWGDSKNARYEAGLNDIVIVKVDKLEALLRRAKCLPPYDQKPCNGQEIALYIDGRRLKGLKPESGSPILENSDSTPSPTSTPTATPTASPTPSPSPAVSPAAAGTTNASPPSPSVSPAISPTPWRFSDGTLRYHLKRNVESTDNADPQDSKEHWADLLGLSSNPAGWSFRRRVDVSVGLEDDYPVKTEVRRRGGKGDKEFYLLRVLWMRIIPWGLFALFVIYGLYRLAKETTLLRDRAPLVWNRLRRNQINQPYSLSAVQAAWWFVIIFLTFIAIWLITGERDFSATALILLTIGFGTALGGTVIDANKRSTGVGVANGGDELNKLLLEKRECEAELNRLSNEKEKLEIGSANLKAEIQSLENAIKKNKSEDAKKKFETDKQVAENKLKQIKDNILLNEQTLNTKEALYNKKIEDIKIKFPRALGLLHETFYIDILSDASGISFHRYQMLIWSLILGIFFIISALGRLAMPDFDVTLLTLMGISAGTYLAFKVPENSGVPTIETKPDDNAGGGADGGGNAGGNGVDNANVELPLATIDPAQGWVGTKVKISVKGFSKIDKETKITFDVTPIKEFEFTESTITLLTPAHPEGKVKVVVEGSEGKKAETEFTYGEKPDGAGEEGDNAGSNEDEPANE
ncbi:MAG TPA: IPT/TIG domain-containing protein [Pyrinomonadaceae bacterium]|jgi:hypothetical protein